MLIQHLLTERIFRTVFNNPDFTRRNVIAAEIEKVIDALTSQAFSREGFLQSLDRFYKAIDTAARTIEDFSQKQLFLNTIYEKFFQGFSVKVADTHGIVYTPQPIVNFMVRSVEDILQKEFGKSLSSSDVHILDPFVGTGNFIVHIMQAIKKTALPQKYQSELHCNEVMLLPYYIASMNIEHEFYELTGSYEPFEGICLVDTFELAEARQISFFSTENTARVERQRQSPIKVVIGNPPYNIGQLNENDNNKNRKYKAMDARVAETYVKASRAKLKSKYGDPYIKAIRWASDRIGGDGVVALVTNSSFLHKNVFDGIRKHLAADFDSIYILDLGGSVKDNPKLSGTTHNVFGIKPGVSISLFVRRSGGTTERQALISYSVVGEYWRKEEKYDYLDDVRSVTGVSWKSVHPDKRFDWVADHDTSDFWSFIAVGSSEGRQADRDPQTIFHMYSPGVSTNRDSTAYAFDLSDLSRNIEHFGEQYNAELARYLTAGRPKEIDDFLNYARVKWSRNLKRDLKSSKSFSFNSECNRLALYRPYTKKHLYFADMVVDELGKNPYFFPNTAAEMDNIVIYLSDKGFRSPFSTLAVNCIADLHLCSSADGFQAFPFYVHGDRGIDRHENITDWALEQFRTHNADKAITKWDIFHYVYALLHHPLYRAQYAANLKRELPRIPLVRDFRGFAEIGKRVAEIHVHYEQQPEYPLDKIETPGVPLEWRVEKMKLSKDKRSLIYNDFLTLSGIPPEVFEYRLGNRSALEWIIDQYQVSTDKRSGITNDPNRPDDPEYIVRLIGQVITVSLETVKLVSSLATLPILADIEV